MACDDIIRTLAQSIGPELDCRTVAGGVLLALPVYYHNGDAVEVVVAEDSGRLLVADAGLSALHLAGHGIDLQSNGSTDRLARVTEYALAHGCDFVDDEVIRYTTQDGLFTSLFEVAEVARMVAALADAIPTNRSREFNAELSMFFRRLDARPILDYRIDGYTRADVFDVRLNGSHETLIRTIAEKSPSRIFAKIERSWYAFEDVRKVGRQFRPSIVFDDTDEEFAQAWRPGHFQMLDRLDIPVFGFVQNEDQLVEIGLSHSDPGGHH